MEKIFSNKVKFLFLIILLGLSFINNVKAQCSGCTVNANNSTSSYNVVSGQTLCCSINYTGSISLNGGVVCNTGTIVSMAFLGGKFENYGVYNQPGVSMAPTAPVTVRSYNGSKITFAKIQFNGAAGRPLAIYVYKGASIDFTNTVDVNTGSFSVEVGTSNPSSNPVPTSTLTASNYIAAYSDFSLNFLTGCSSNFSNELKLAGTGIKSVTNNGTFNSSRDITAISAGSSTSTVTITNYSVMSIRSFTADYTAGKVFFYNLNDPASFNATSTMLLAKTTNTFANSGSLKVNQNFTVQAGLAVNCGSMVTNAVVASGGTVTNNYSLTCNADFSVTSTSAVVNNNSYLNVSSTFNNLGTVNFGQKAILYTVHYNNLASTAYINGPSSVADSTCYGKIVIKGNSNNTGNVTAKMMVDDQGMVSTSTNIGYGFDAITTPSLIAASVLFGSIGASPGTGNPATLQCWIKKNIYGVPVIDASPTTTPPCGQTVNLTSKIQTNYYSYSWPTNTQSTQTLVIPFVGGTTFAWSPSGLFTNPNIQVGSTIPVVNTTYTVLITFVGCVYSKTIALSPVISITSALTATASKCPNSLLVLNATGGGGTAPYTYSWTPTTSLTPGNTPSSATQTVGINSNTNYTVTVSDVYGCAKSFTCGVSIISTSINPGMALTYSVCNGGSLTISSSVSGGGGPSYTYSWTPGSSTAYSIAVTSLTASTVYQFQVTTPVGCVQIFPVTINASPQIIINSPTTFYTNSNVPVQLGITPIASGGLAPYTYTWTGSPPPFVPNANAANPFVTTPSNTTYSLLVKDSYLCTQAQVFTVTVISSPAYATLKKQVDAGFYQVAGNMLYFTVDGEYNGAAALNCKIYDIDHTVVSSPGSMALKNGDNRYVVNLSAMGLSSTKLYTMEIVNEKNEVFLLKFKN